MDSSFIYFFAFGLLLTFGRWFALPIFGAVEAAFRPRYRQPLGATPRRAFVLLLPLGCAAVIALPALHPWFAQSEHRHISEVRLAGGFFLAFFFTLWGCGFNLRNDVLESDNPPAALAVTAAALAPLPAIFGLLVAPYNGGFWAMALATMAASWFLLEIVSRISERITIDRDLGAGIRLAAFLLAMAICPVRALHLVHTEDNFLPYPVAALVALLPLVLAAMVIERWKRVPQYPLAPLRSLPIAALYLVLGLGGTAIFR